MRKIAITLPWCYEGEAEDITHLLVREGFWRVHIRKPDASAAQTADLIERIPCELYPLLTLHDHHELALEYNLGGVHLNMRNPEAPQGWKGMVSRSLHSLEQIAVGDFDYAFLSPIYPSISKPGYKGNFSHDDLRNSVNKRIFALGGVTPDKFTELEAFGFGGAAMLGSVWRAQIPRDAFRLQFITHPMEGRTMVQEVLPVLQGGCRWIQLRHKGASPEILIAEGDAIGKLCRQTGAIFILDDHVELVNRVGADGVHLGKNDMPVAQARRLLGPHKIIGATANSFEDIMAAAQDGADYIGLGPFRFTTTKEKLSPVLGIKGYDDIIRRCREECINIPIVAIGGIEQADIHPIMETGVNGIAVSGMIRNAPDPAAATQIIAAVLGNGENRRLES